MNADITFTASDKLYSLHPDADALTVSDQIDARQAQLTALLAMTRGAAGEVFRTMTDPLQESYMWACEMLAMEVQELLSARADMERGGRMNTLNEGIWTLWNKARGALTDDELLALTEGSSLAECQAKQAARVCDNLGALISNDEANGTMEDGKSVAAMVWVLGNQFDMIASLYDIADRAREELHERLGMGIDLLCARKKAREEQGAPPQG